MSRELIESIVSNNMLEANDMVEAKLAEIRERKIYEMKRMFAAKMHEGVGGLTRAEIEARKKAGYRKAADVLGDPREGDKKTPKLNPSAKILKKKVVEQALDEIRTPGEVPGSEERKQDAARLRAARSGFRALDIGKEGRQKFTKDYLTTRRSQMAAGASQKEPEAAPEVKLEPGDAKPLSRRQRLAQQGLKMLKARSGGKPTSVRYDAALDRAKELEKRGRAGAVARVKKAYTVHRIKQGIKAAGTGIKNAASRVLNSPVMQDLHSIGTRNL